MSEVSSSPDSARGVLATELKVLGTVGVFLLLVEMGLQIYEPHLSVDIQHLQSFSSVSSEVRSVDESRHAAESGTTTAAPQLLFLGNSTTRHGLDRTAFLSGLTSFGPPPELIALHPDNSRISEWNWLYQNYIAEQGRAPDVLIVGFAKEQLRDAPSKTPDRIARFYGCTWDDVPQLAVEDVKGVEGWANFAMSRYSATFANRERVERRILGAVIPHYQESSNIINNRSQPRELLSAAAPPTYQRLETLLAQARHAAVQVVLVAMPVQESYDLDPALAQLVYTAGAKLVDCRHVPGVTADMIPDGLHLTAEGAALYSRHLAEQLPVQQMLARREQQLAPAATPRWVEATGSDESSRR